MAAIAAIAAGVGAAVSIGGGIIAAEGAKKDARNARGAKKEAQAEINTLISARQDIINPYESTEDLSSMAKDLSGQISNPFASLGVATQAAEIQMEQTDIALANTLDTLRATGASAGGATALAQAALQSKKGVAASIESQEAANEKAKAQGEANLNQQKMSEQQRIQGIAIAEGRRVQSNDAAGKQFEYQTRERRSEADLDSAQGKVDQAAQAEAQANAARSAAWGGVISAGGSLASAGLGSMGGASAAPKMGGGFSGGGSFASIASSGPPPVDFSQFGSNPGSDRRLKKNIIKIGESGSGLNIYNFEYLNPKFGKGTYQGVMSDEVPVESVLKGEDGYDRVDYSKLDVEFKKIKNEL